MNTEQKQVFDFKDIKTEQGLTFAFTDIPGKSKADARDKLVAALKDAAKQLEDAKL